MHVKEEKIMNKKAILVIFAILAFSSFAIAAAEPIFLDDVDAALKMVSTRIDALRFTYPENGPEMKDLISLQKNIQSLSARRNQIEDTIDRLDSDSRPPNAKRAYNERELTDNARAARQVDNELQKLIGQANSIESNFRIVTDEPAIAQTEQAVAQTEEAIVKSEIRELTGPNQRAAIAHDSIKQIDVQINEQISLAGQQALQIEYNPTNPDLLQQQKAANEELRFQLEAARVRLEQEIALSSARADLEQAVASMEADNQQLKSKLKAANAKIRALKQTIKTLQEAGTPVRPESPAADPALQENITRLQSQLDSANQRIAELEAQAVTAQQRVTELEARLGEQTRISTELTAKNEKLKAGNARLQERLAASQNERLRLARLSKAGGVTVEVGGSGNVVVTGSNNSNIGNNAGKSPSTSPEATGRTGGRANPPSSTPAEGGSPPANQPTGPISEAPAASEPVRVAAGEPATAEASAAASEARVTRLAAAKSMLKGFLLLYLINAATDIVGYGLQKYAYYPPSDYYLAPRLLWNDLDYDQAINNETSLDEKYTTLVPPAGAGSYGELLFFKETSMLQKITYSTINYSADWKLSTATEPPIYMEGKKAGDRTPSTMLIRTNAAKNIFAIRDSLRKAVVKQWSWWGSGTSAFFDQVLANLVAPRTLTYKYEMAAYGSPNANDDTKLVKSAFLVIFPTLIGSKEYSAQEAIFSPANGNTAFNSTIPCKKIAAKQAGQGNWYCDFSVLEKPGLNGKYLAGFFVKLDEGVFTSEETIIAKMEATMKKNKCNFARNSDGKDYCPFFNSLVSDKKLQEELAKSKEEALDPKGAWAAFADTYAGLWGSYKESWAKITKAKNFYNVFQGIFGLGITTVSSPFVALDSVTVSQLIYKNSRMNIESEYEILSKPENKEAVKAMLLGLPMFEEFTGAGGTAQASGLRFSQVLKASDLTTELTTIIGDKADIEKPEAFLLKIEGIEKAKNLIVSVNTECKSAANKTTADFTSTDNGKLLITIKEGNDRLVSSLKTYESTNINATEVFWKIEKIDGKEAKDLKGTFTFYACQGSSQAQLEVTFGSSVTPPSLTGKEGILEILSQTNKNFIEQLLQLIDKKKT